MPPEPEFMADTNVVSYVITGHELAEHYAPFIASGRTIGISFQALAELRVGQRTQRWSRRRFEAVLRRFVEVPLSREAERIWVEIRADSIERQRRGVGRVVSAADAWIAATVMAVPCPLLTHNFRDFKQIRGLSLAARADPRELA